MGIFSISTTGHVVVADSCGVQTFSIHEAPDSPEQPSEIVGFWAFGLGFEVSYSDHSDWHSCLALIVHINLNIDLNQ